MPPEKHQPAPTPEHAAEEREPRKQRVLALPRHGGSSHILALDYETQRAPDGRAFARIMLRDESDRRSTGLRLFPSELRSLAVALQQTAIRIERERSRKP